MHKDDSSIDKQRPSQVAASRDALEGRLLAHRTILTLMLAEMRRTGGAAPLMAMLDTLSVVQDHQEDPGASTEGPEVIEGALAEEIAAVVRAAAADPLTPGESG